MDITSLDIVLSEAMVVFILLGAILVCNDYYRRKILLTTSIVFDDITGEEKRLLEDINFNDELDECERAYLKEKYKCLLNNRLLRYNEKLDYRLDIEEGPLNFYMLVSFIISLLGTIGLFVWLGGILMEHSGLQTSINILSAIWTIVFYIMGVRLAITYIRTKFNDHFYMAHDPDINSRELVGISSSKPLMFYTLTNTLGMSLYSIFILTIDVVLLLAHTVLSFI